MDIIFTSLAFDDLDLFQLYEIMVLRQEVFIVEQDCPYLDADGRDQKSIHLLGRSKQGQLLAYARVLPKGQTYKDYNSIGRVVISSTLRGKGYGHPLMQKAIEVTKAHFGDEAIKISAQAHLEQFYASLSFKRVGEEYLEDGIPHIGMIL